MLAAVRRHIQKFKIGLLVIDYLQLMQVIGWKENRTQDVTEISRGIKLAARKFSLPVIVLAQINRAAAIESRPPQLHDLRESVAIEQDSDKVIFLHPESTTAVSVGIARPTHEVRMIVAKQRDGKSGLYVKLLFLEKCARFEEQTKDADHE